MTNDRIISNVKHLDTLNCILEYHTYHKKHYEYRFYIKQDEPFKLTRLIVKSKDEVEDVEKENNKITNKKNKLYTEFLNQIFQEHEKKLMEIEEDTKIYKETSIQGLYQKLIENIAYPNDNEENRILTLEELEKEDRKLFEAVVKDHMRELVREFNIRKNVESKLVILSDFMQLFYGIKRQYRDETTFQEDIKVKAYNLIHKHDIGEIIKQYGFKVKDKDVETIISYIDTDLKPIHNKVKFNNLIYDMLEHEVYTPEEAILAHRQVDLDYKQHDHTTINSYLRTSLKQTTEEETETYIQGIKELIGYFFTSGNTENKIITLTGVRGGGKSTFIRLLNNIFGIENISNTSFNRLTLNQFGTAALRNKALNISNDADQKPIYDIGLLKQISGYDNVEIEQKGKDLDNIEREEVPKLMLAGNHIPEFKNLDDALLERLIIIRFRYTFRGTEKENTEFSKGFPKEEIEGFVYDCLKAYKEHVESNQSFILDKEIDETQKLLEMYSKPYNYLISELLIYDPGMEEDEGLRNVEVYQAVLKLAKFEGIELSIKTKQGTMKKIIQAIREEYDLSIENYSVRDIRDEDTNRTIKIYPQMKKRHVNWDMISD